MAALGTLHQHIIAELRALISAGKFAPGEKFLSEREIAELFQTSRPTANKALSSLVSEGVLEMRPGSGAFVRESVLDYDLECLVSFTDKVRAAGMEPTTKLLEFRKLPASDAPASVRESLLADGSDELIYLERIRLAGGKPVIYESRHVVAALCQSMSREDAQGSLFAFWTAKCGLSITAEEVIHAVSASEAQAAHLRIAAQVPCFQIVTTGFVEDDRLLWHDVALYRADMCEFRHHIGGNSGRRPGVGRNVGGIRLI